MAEVMRWAIVFSDFKAKDDQLNDKVRREIQKAQELYEKLLNSNFEIFQRRLDLKVQFRVSRGDNHVEHIKGLSNKEHIHFIITAKAINHIVGDASWMINNKIKILFEIICDNQNIYVESPNYFSGRIHVAVNKIRYIVLDIMVDLLFEHVYKTHTLFKALFSKKDFTPKEYDLTNKLNFIKEVNAFPKQALTENVNYTFSFLNRGTAYNNVDNKNVFNGVDLLKLNELWLSYFKWVVKKIDKPGKAVVSKNLPHLRSSGQRPVGVEISKHGIPIFTPIKSFYDLLSLMPKKRIKQINLLDLEMKFENLSYQHPEKVFLILIKSVIDHSYKKKRAIRSVFGTTKLNATAFLDLARHHIVPKIRSHVVAIYIQLNS